MLGDFLPAAVAGDRRAIERVLAYIRPLVVRYCRARVSGGSDLPDDVAQDVCLAVLTSLPSYRDQGRPFLAFVYGIAAHKVADSYRRRNHLHDQVLGSTGVGIARLIEQSSLGRPQARLARSRASSRHLRSRTNEVMKSMLEEHGMATQSASGERLGAELPSELSRLFQLLPEKQREILVLRVMVGLSAEETAEAVGSTPGAVRVAQHRAIGRLRKEIEAAESTLKPKFDS
ncbi:sigma-70 family RNA polymerase sigma factor [Lentzea sp. HUAS12]|nr:sigma-70 family RNA polymerase sigma factor [Lentzea sp. HUAS12]USX56763.1 sigma-70 family RNA polymerase sigma factor [Lentzea sp. HUAS12]